MYFQFDVPVLLHIFSLEGTSSGVLYCDLDLYVLTIIHFCRQQVNDILSQDNELKYVTQLIGEENLPEGQQLDIFIAKQIKEGFLIQNAFDEIDSYTNTGKLLGMIKMLLLIYKEGKELLKQGFFMDDIKSLKSLNAVIRIGREIPNDDYMKIETLKKKFLSEIESLKLKSGRIRL